MTNAKNKADITNNELILLQARAGIMQKLQGEIVEKQYLLEAVEKDANANLKELAKKYGLVDAPEYAVENGTIIALVEAPDTEAKAE